MAADILDCGKDKVWIDPRSQAEVDEAITRADVRRLIKQGKIQRARVNQQSRGRAREMSRKKKAGRRSGPGRQKGGRQSGESDKEKWIKTIRPLRKRLKELRDRGELKEGAYRKLYKMAKSGAFRSTSHLELYMEENDLREEPED